MTSETKRILLQILLFVTTFLTTTLAGAEFCFGKSVFAEGYTWDDFYRGMQFSIPLIAILTAHEFGHYFVAIYHKVKTSLPYYIPIPPIPFFINFGTMGAVIRLRSRPKNNLQHFDIGLAGPLAGFVVAIALLFYGFATLPPPEYVFEFHPEYKQYGIDYGKYVYEPEYYTKHFAAQGGVLDIKVGKNLIFLFFEKFVGDPARIPNPHELMHYPILMACFFALFVTCLNLLPIGQLDGGHVTYGLFGFRKHKIIATVFFIALLLYSGLGNDYINPRIVENNLLISMPLYVLFLYFMLTGLKLPTRDTAMYAVLIFAFHFMMIQFLPEVKGYFGWLVFAFVVGRFVGIQHPRSEIEEPLNTNRIVLGWLTLLVFVLCFSPMPLSIDVYGATMIF